MSLSSEVFTESKLEVKMRLFYLLLCCWVSASMAAVPVILDTDMDFDVDDVGALCVLHALQVSEELINDYYGDTIWDCVSVVSTLT